MSTLILLFFFFFLLHILKTPGLLVRSPILNGNETLYLASYYTNFCTIPPRKSFLQSGQLIYPNPNDACTPLTTNVTGKVVLVVESRCTFATQGINIMEAGALAMITIYTSESSCPDQLLANVYLPIYCATISFQDGLTLIHAIQNSSVTAYFYQEPIQTSQLVVLEAFLNQTQSNAWNLSVDPCTADPQFSGLQCNEEGMINYFTPTFAFKGTIPTNFASFTNLTLFAVGNDHSLVGSIPNSLISWRLIQCLILVETGISEFPPELLQSWTRLLFLQLDSNHLAGPLPHFYGTTLIYLSLSGNFFSGTIPSSFWISSVRSFDLSQNLLSGIIDLTQLSDQVISIDLSSNNFTEIREPLLFNSLQTLILRNNRLEAIPEDFWHSFPLLQFLDVSFNLFSNLSNLVVLSQLATLSMSQNLFTEFPVIPQSVIKLRANDNQIRSLALLCQIQSPKLLFLDLSSNNLTGGFGDIFDCIPSTVTELYLSRNGLYSDFKPRSRPLTKLDISFNSLNGRPMTR